MSTGNGHLIPTSFGIPTEVSLMGSFEDHLLGGTVDVPSGNVKRLRGAAEGLSGVGTAANPVTIRLASGTYTLDRPLTIPSFCSIVGAGRDATIIQRTTALTNTAYGGTQIDPVLECTSKQSVTLENLSIIHSGTTDASISTTTKNPVALMSGACKRLKIKNVRLEGSYAGWFDKTDSVDTTFNKPIPDNKIGDEDWQYRLDNCIIVGHSASAAQQISRHELFATGCTFMCDIRSTDVLNSTAMPTAFNHWEYLVGHYRSCQFILKSAQTLVVSSVTQNACSFAILDTSITDTVAYCDDCTFYLDLGDGDINSANSCGCCVYVSGTLGTGGTIYNYNVFNANGCRFRYETGTITSAPAICGLYMESQTGVNTAVEGRLKNCIFEDVAGSGGTRRRDIIITGRLANVQAKSLTIENCNIQDYDYRNVTGSPVYTHASFMTEPNTMNHQRGSVTFSPSGTSVSAALPLAFTASAGITDYAVFLEPNENNTFWVSDKTNSGFTLNANAATAGTIRFVVRR